MRRESHARFCERPVAKSHRPTPPHFCTRSRKWGTFVIGRKTIKKRMRAKLLAIKIELRRSMHDPIAKTGTWVKQMLKGHLNYFAVSGSQREQILAWLASPRFAGDARLRHDGGDPPSRQSGCAKKNATPNQDKNKDVTTQSLIRWSIQEVRRIATRLARKRIQPAHIIAWSLWRRAHQAAAQRAHFKAYKQL